MSQLMESIWFSAAAGVAALPAGLLLVVPAVRYAWSTTCRAVERSYGKDAVLKMKPIATLMGYGLALAIILGFPYALAIHFGPPLLFDVFGRHGKCLNAYLFGSIPGGGVAYWMTTKSATAYRRPGPPRET